MRGMPMLHLDCLFNEPTHAFLGGVENGFRESFSLVASLRYFNRTLGILCMACVFVFLFLFMLFVVVVKHRKSFA